MNIEIQCQELTGIVILVQYDEFVVGDIADIDDCMQYHATIGKLDWTYEGLIFVYLLNTLVSFVRVNCEYFLEG